MSDTITVGERIRILRRKKGWSQYDLAEKSGVLRQTITLIETSRVNRIRYENVVAIAKALEVSPDELYGNIPEEKRPIYDAITELEEAKKTIDAAIDRLKKI